MGKRFKKNFPFDLSHRVFLFGTEVPAIRRIYTTLTRFPFNIVWVFNCGDFSRRQRVEIRRYAAIYRSNKLGDNNTVRVLKALKAITRCYDFIFAIIQLRRLPFVAFSFNQNTSSPRANDSRNDINQGPRLWGISDNLEIYFKGKDASQRSCEMLHRELDNCCFLQAICNLSRWLIKVGTVDLLITWNISFMRQTWNFLARFYNSIIIVNLRFYPDFCSPIYACS